MSARWTGIAACSVTLASLACAPAGVDDAPSVRASIDAVLRGAVERREVAGVVAVAAFPSGVFYEGAFGKRDVGDGVDMSLDSMFRLASMTKAVTSVAAMQLVDEGELELDAPVSTYLPEFAPRVLEGFDAASGEPRLRESSTSVTVRHLLTHTAGFGYSIWNPLLREAAEHEEFSGLAAPLIHDPGAAWTYGINTDWLGRVVEALRNASLEEVFREHIFEPLGMHDSSYNVPEPKHARVVTVHERGQDGRLTELDRPAPAGQTTFSGGGGLVSTAADYLRFTRMLLNNGELDGARILAPGTLALMAENHIGDLEAGTMATEMPETSNDFDFFPASSDRFGLGFLLNTEPVTGGRAPGSLAWAGLYNTYFWVDRRTGVSGVLLTQVLPFYDGPVVTLLDAFERAVYDSVRAGS